MSSLADVLIEERIITQEQLKEARDKQAGAKKPIQELLVEMGFIKEEDLVKVSSRIFKMPISDLTEESVDTRAAKIISYEIAKRYGVLPVAKKGNVLVLAMSDPADVIALDTIKNITGMEIEPILSTKSGISASIEKYYHLDETLYDLLKNITDGAYGEVVSSDREAKEVEESAVTRLVDLILSDGARERASDIHIEPQEKFISVRYRIDGDLRSIIKIPKKLHPHLVSRLKILADLDIAERRKPQDGRVRISVGGADIDLRIAVMPTFHGEKIALRLLDTEGDKIRLDNVGLNETQKDIFQKMINRSQGMVLVTGPTGSGKTSTIYAALNDIKHKARNIVTIEDPIEYLIEGINQTQINPVKDLTFANGLRSILRQDPNVILVGEIRDKETAEIAFRASLTGHLVFTTLHTNNSISTITRLWDMGLEPYLVSSSIVLIVAQRLLKLICPECKESYLPPKTLLEKFNIYLAKYGLTEYGRGSGCKKCNYTGFFGRTAIFEMLTNTEKIRGMIADRASEDEIFKEARKEGLRPLAESGIEKVARGLTTLEEVDRATDIIEEGPPQEEADRHDKVKVLVTDDDVFMRKMVIGAFAQEKDNFDFAEAKNGREALKAVCLAKPDLLISDVLMPEMNGYELVRTLRGRLESASIPIMMLTSQADKESEIKGLDAGADDYITKPFDRDRLVARAKMLLRKTR